ncbi:cytochrome c oxidase assembly protein PET191 [Piptocephalis cylindrospora]|uniref:Cytochrome c oxidase assembly protein PET191 n=1 Tax=Piptocephalis cylindrospora TaxID=1907219 RepID=A0A4P9Y6W9_9FUNG|nr:cytochrome c oxidase assembly protein PET191 [Piptocephalis cylindrospora]|eukprot:RKP14848.1 cytochrome c oxidase assembly protein PET191 [Piptocephalis cylindrospora]
MPSSCMDIRKDLIECILASECVKREGKSVKDCLDDSTRPADSVPDKCLAIRRSYFECRRGILDPKLRFRGNKS